MLVGGLTKATAYKWDSVKHDMPSHRRKFLLTHTFDCETFAKADFLNAE
jgi:hypothetical protein